MSKLSYLTIVNDVDGNAVFVEETCESPGFPQQKSIRVC